MDVQWNQKERSRYTIDCETQGGNQYHDKNIWYTGGTNTSKGSQFFIVHTRQATAHLDGGLPLRKVTEGLEVIDQIRQGDTFSVNIDE